MLIIPVMYLRGESVLKPAGRAASPIKSDPFQLALDWSKAGAELIHIVDLDTPATGPSPNINILKKIHTGLKIGIEVEGFVRDLETAEKYFAAGVERISLGAIAYQKPAFLADLCKRFPGKIGVHIDVKRGRVQIKGWSVATNKTALDYVEQFKLAGVTVIYYSDIEEEGALKPTDFARVREFLKKALVKVIHTTDFSNNAELEQLIMLESYGMIGSLISHPLYEGRIDLENSITFIKEKSPGLDEPTYTEER